MSSPATHERCPSCGNMVSVRAVRCPTCNEELFDTLPRMPRPRKGFEATELLIPTNVSAWSIAACYLGLIGFLLPIIGFFIAFPALICGIIALRRKRKAVTYGSVTSDIRAVFGVVLGGLGTLVWGALVLMWLVHTIRAR